MTTLSRHYNDIHDGRLKPSSHFIDMVTKPLHQLVKELYPRSLDCTANMGYCFGYIKLI